MLVSRLNGGRLGDFLVAEADGAGGDLLEAADHAQRGGLAAAGRTEQGEELAALDVERQIVDGDHVAEALGDPFEPNVRLRHLA